MTEVQKADPKGRQLEVGAQGPVAPRLPVYDKTMQWNNYKWVFGEDWEHKNTYTKDSWSVKAGLKGRQLEVGAQQAPRLLVSYILFH